MENVNVLIIGSGPAGYTAAIYAARAGMKPVLYTGGQPGGQLTITTDVENYPGYPEGIMGPEMMEDFRKQAERFGTQIRYGVVTQVDFSARPYRVIVDDRLTLLAETVIISTGASAKWLGLESETRLNGRGVSACAVCDGFFFRGQEKNNPKIEILWNTETLEILGDQEVTGVKILNNKTQKISEISISGFFVAIGHQPNTEIFKEYITMDASGYIKTIPGTTKTNVEGVFACGDAQDNVYRQAVTAAGTGCMAALDAERFLAATGIH